MDTVGAGARTHAPLALQDTVLDLVANVPEFLDGLGQGKGGGDVIYTLRGSLWLHTEN